LEIQSVQLLAEDVDYSDVDRVYLKGQTYKFRYLTIYSTLSRATNLVVTPSSTTQLDLTWTDNSSGESGFEVWRSSAIESGWSLITTTAANATSYNDTGLTASTQYYYRIRPTDGTYGGEWSLIVGGRTNNSGVTPSGILYKTTIFTGQTTSYRTGDDAWNRANGVYDYTRPSNPATVAEEDPDNALKLLENNAFGNKNRWGDSVGNQNADGTGGSIVNYGIDTLTRLGYEVTRMGAATWNDAIDNAQSATDRGFSDWRLPNIKEMENIMNLEQTNALDYFPFNLGTLTTTDDYWTSTTDDTDTTKAYVVQARNGNTAGYNVKRTVKTNTAYYLLVRNHY
jgi:hypothetical protein